MVSVGPGDFGRFLFCLTALLWERSLSAEAVFGVGAPLSAAKIELRIGEEEMAVRASARVVVLEELHGSSALRTTDLKSMVLCEITTILAGAFHLCLLHRC